MPLRAYLAGLAALFVIAAGRRGGLLARAVVERRARGRAGRRALRAPGWRPGRPATGVTPLQQTVASAAANPGIAEAFAHPRSARSASAAPTPTPPATSTWCATDGASSAPRARGAGTYAGAPWLARALQRARPARAGRPIRAPARRRARAAPASRASASCSRSSTSTASARACAPQLRRPARARVPAHDRRPHRPDALARARRWIGAPLRGRRQRTRTSTAARAYRPGLDGWRSTPAPTARRRWPRRRRLDHRELCDHPGRARAVPGRVGSSHRRIARPLDAARRASARRARGHAAPPAGRRARRGRAGSRTRLNELGETRSGLPRPVRRQPAADVGPRHADPPHPRGQFRRGRDSTAPATRGVSVDALEHAPGPRTPAQRRRDARGQRRLAPDRVPRPRGLRRDRRGRDREGAPARSSCSSRSGWRASGSSPAASRTTSTTCSR